MGVQINGSEGNVIATKGTYSGNVTIGGTLTYEDVTNIDSVGLVTARTGIEIGARPGVAASISVDGNMIVSGVSTFGGTANFGSTVQVSTGNLDIADSIRHVGDSNTKIRFPANDTISFEAAGSEAARFDANGRLLIGLTESQTTDSNAHSKLQVASSAGPNIGLGNNSSDIDGGDRLGVINYSSNHGGTYHEVTTLRSAADADHTSSSKASRLELYTTSSGNTQATERFRITSDGRVLIQEGTFSERLLGATAKLQVEGTGAPSSTISITRNSNDTNPAYLMFGKSRGTATGANTILQTGDSIGGLFFYGADGNDIYNESAFIRAGIATGRTEAIPTVGSNSTPGVLEFATTLDGDAGARKHIEIDSDGIFKMMTGNTENDNNSGFDTNQNPIGFYKIKVNDESNSSDILMPKPGCFVFIQPYSTYPAFPQPQGSICYIDSGHSKNGAEILDPFSLLSVKTSMTYNVSNCDDNKYTVMPGVAYQTLRITNRLDTEPYTFCITMI